METFLYYAFNSLFIAVHHLVSGLTISSGHMMRHFGEGLAMAMLCSHRGVTTYSNFERDPERFPIHKVLKEILRRDNRSMLGVDGVAYLRFKGMVDWYDNLSHPTPLAVSTLFFFAMDGTRQIGGEFDQEKVDVLRGELRRAISACDVLEDTIIAATTHLHTSVPNQKRPAK